MKVAYYTLGCKVNQYETEVMREQMEQRGFDTVDFSNIADVYIVNTCTVTAVSDKKSRQILSRARRLNPNAVIVAAGCLPQTSENVPHADILIGTEEKNHAAQIICDFISKRDEISCLPLREVGLLENIHTFTPSLISKMTDRTRATVKIQDGCRNFCTYCIIPFARGPLRSKAPDEAVGEVKALAEAGFCEIVLCGIHLASYGRGTDTSLADLMAMISRESVTTRIRLGSLEPVVITDEFLASLASIPGFCPQFHLSLQSGCTETLKRMHRHYTAEQYMQAVEKIRKVFPNGAITTDIMVGFPGETDDEFASSLEFAKAVGFARAHVFSYSRRKGTLADKMPNQIPEPVKAERSAAMIAATDETRRQYEASFIGKTLSVLFEREKSAGVYDGFSENYICVHAKSSRDISGKVINVKITSTHEEGLFGELI